MKINKKIANGITIDTDDFQYIKAVRKIDADTKIIREFWFSGKAKVFQNKNKKIIEEEIKDEEMDK